jgi:hypothetical protein
MQVGAEFVVMVETTITANGKTIVNPIIRVTRPQAGFNPRFLYFVDNQTVGQPRHWYVGDGNGNVVVSDVDVVDSTTSSALATALTNQLTAAGYLSGTHTGTVNDVPETYNSKIRLTITPSIEDLENYDGEFLCIRHTFEIGGVLVTNPIVYLSDIDPESNSLEMCTDDNQQGFWTDNGLVPVESWDDFSNVQSWLNTVYDTDVFNPLADGSQESQPDFSAYIEFV